MVHGLSGAPDGYRDGDTPTGGGEAREEIGPDEARGVRPGCAGVGRERRRMGEGGRRLTQAGEVTRTGQTVWERSVVGGRLHHPAYTGAAAFGKTRYEPRRPRVRAQRTRPLQPRRAGSGRDVPADAWLTIAGPARVEADLLTAVPAQRRENQRHARHARRGARYLLPGFVLGHPWGEARYGTPIRRKAATGHARLDAS